MRPRRSLRNRMHFPDQVEGALRVRAEIKVSERAEIREASLADSFEDANCRVGIAGAGIVGELKEL